MKNTEKSLFRDDIMRKLSSEVIGEADYSSMRRNVINVTETMKFSRSSYGKYGAPFLASIFSVIFILMVAFSVNIRYNGTEEAGNEVLFLSGNGHVSLSWKDFGSGEYRVIKSTSPDFSRSGFLQWQEVDGNKWVDREPLLKARAVFYRIERKDDRSVVKGIEKIASSS